MVMSLPAFVLHLYVFVSRGILFEVKTSYLYYSESRMKHDYDVKKLEDYENSAIKALHLTGNGGHNVLAISQVGQRTILANGRNRGIRCVGQCHISC